MESALDLQRGQLGQWSQAQGGPYVASQHVAVAGEGLGADSRLGCRLKPMVEVLAQSLLRGPDSHAGIALGESLVQAGSGLLLVAVDGLAEELPLAVGVSAKVDANKPRVLAAFDELTGHARG